MHSFHWWQLFWNLLCDCQEIFSFRSSALSQLELTAFLIPCNHDQLRCCGRNKLRHSSPLWSIVGEAIRWAPPSGALPAAVHSKPVLMLFADILKEGEGFREVLGFWEGVDQTLCLVQPLTLFYFFYPSTADQTVTGESWNWEERQCILKMKTFLVDLVM